ILCYPVTDVNYTVHVTFVDNGQSCNFSAMYPVKAVRISPNILIGTVICDENGTPNKITDNRIKFSMQVNGSNVGSNYTVTVDGGTTITPVSASYNIPVQFTLGPGTAGGGTTFTVSITDSQTQVCTSTIVVVDPNNCQPASPPCDTIKCGTATIEVKGN
ncbi:MAG: hypothetical protein WAU01_13745, partial [Saprospiraceae bacterium]